MTDHVSFGNGGAADALGMERLWVALVRRRQLVVVFFLASVLTGAALVYFAAPVFEARVALRIGHLYTGTGSTAYQFEDARELEERLVSTYGKRLSDGTRRARPFLIKALPSKSGTMIELAVEGDTANSAADFLVRVVENVVGEHDKQIDNSLTPIQEHLREIEAQFGELQQEYQGFNRMYARLKNEDIGQASLMLLKMSEISLVIRGLDKERALMQQMSNPPFVRPTEPLGEVYAPIQPIKPKPALLISLACLLGLAGGVVLALVVEVFSGGGREKA